MTSGAVWLRAQTESNKPLLASESQQGDCPNSVEAKAVGAPALVPEGLISVQQAWLPNPGVSTSARGQPPWLKSHCAAAQARPEAGTSGCLRMADGGGGHHLVGELRLPLCTLPRVPGRMELQFPSVITYLITLSTIFWDHFSNTPFTLKSALDLLREDSFWNTSPTLSWLNKLGPSPALPSPRAQEDWCAPRVHLDYIRYLQGQVQPQQKQVVRRRAEGGSQRISK